MTPVHKGIVLWERSLELDEPESFITVWRELLSLLCGTVSLHVLALEGDSISIFQVMRITAHPITNVYLFNTLFEFAKVTIKQSLDGHMSGKDVMNRVGGYDRCVSQSIWNL